MAFPLIPLIINSKLVIQSLQRRREYFFKIVPRGRGISRYQLREKHLKEKERERKKEKSATKCKMEGKKI
jgi:hypothetical protein